MRYLPLTPADRQAMLATIGAASIDDLFVDVPAEARLSAPIAGLPGHASEMTVERHGRLGSGREGVGCRNVRGAGQCAARPRSSDHDG